MILSKFYNEILLEKEDNGTKTLLCCAIVTIIYVTQTLYEEMY